jgi:hypothetical protein
MPRLGDWNAAGFGPRLGNWLFSATERSWRVGGFCASAYLRQDADGGSEVLRTLNVAEAFEVKERLRRPYGLPSRSSFADRTAFAGIHERRMDGLPSRSSFADRTRPAYAASRLRRGILRRHS